MTRLFLLRHGPTSWNAEGRIQGHIDIPLSDEGRAMVQDWVLPEGLGGFVWAVSPLRRARETAEILGARDPETVAALQEMHWGAWEGERLQELRARHGAEMAANEARGLDFRPPGGESPRDVQARVAPWLAALGKRRRPTLAVTHKGVIRAIFALALGWDMTGEPPVKLRRAAAHSFAVAPDGLVTVDRLNQPLDEGPAP